MDYLTAQQATEKWGVTLRWAQMLVKNGSIDGAVRFGRVWMIPKDAKKPLDGRRTKKEAAVTEHTGNENNDKTARDAIDEEIAVYSVMENCVFIALEAAELLRNNQIPDMPEPVLVAKIIQIAEEFEREYVYKTDGGDAIKAINRFAKKKLSEPFDLREK